MSVTRGSVAVLVFALLLCPSVTRAIQVVETGQCAGQAPGFSKSVDIPPNPYVILPDNTNRLVDTGRVRPADGRNLRPADDALPVSPVVPGGDRLRAPPPRPA